MRMARKIREDKGLALEDVVRGVTETKISTGNLARFERGLQGMRIAKLKPLADFYGVTMDDLIAVQPPEPVAA